MASDFFLYLKGIDGESLDEFHEDEIEIVSWSWMVSNDGAVYAPTNGGRTTAAQGAINISKASDLASVTLWQYCTIGRHIPEGRITCRKAWVDNEKVEYLVIEMRDITVSSVEFSGTGNEGQVFESISLRFSEFKTTYTQQLDTGDPAGSKQFGWNITKQVPASW